MHTEGAKLSLWSTHLLLLLAVFWLVLSSSRALAGNLLLVHLLRMRQGGVGLTDVERVESTRAKSPTVAWLAGRMAWDRGDVAGATHLWQVAGVANAERLRLLGLDAWQRDKWQSAIELVRVGLEADPSNDSLANLLGLWRLSRGQIVPLREDLQRALARAPQNATALAYRGWTATLQGLPTGTADLERALVLDPDNPAALRFLAELLTLTGGSRARIEQILLRGDNRWPGNDVFCYALAQFYVAGGRYDEADPYINRLRMARPGDAYALEVVAGYYLARGQYAAALQQYRVAARLVPTESRFFIGAGDALVRLGRRNEAEAEYVRAERMNDWRAQERLARLRGSERAQ